MDGIWIGELHLLTTYTHYSALRVITALSLISAIYKSLARANSSESSLVVSWKLLLIVQGLQLPALTSLLSGEYRAIELSSTVKSTIAPSLLSLACRARLNCQTSTELSHFTSLHFTSLHFTSLHFTQLQPVRVKVRVTLWLAVYGQLVRLVAKPFETHDQYFFSTDHLRL
jgi:hypothetical protein